MIERLGPSASTCTGGAPATNERTVPVDVSARGAQGAERPLRSGAFPHIQGKRLTRNDGDPRVIAQVDQAESASTERLRRSPAPNRGAGSAKTRLNGTCRVRQGPAVRGDPATKPPRWQDLWERAPSSSRYSLDRRSLAN